MTAILAPIRWGAGFLLIAWLFAADGMAQPAQAEPPAHEVKVLAEYTLVGTQNAWGVGASTRFRVWRRLGVEPEFRNRFHPWTDQKSVSVTSVYDFGDYRNGSSPYVRGGAGAVVDGVFYMFSVGVRVPVSGPFVLSPELRGNIAPGEGSWLGASVGFGYRF